MASRQLLDAVIFHRANVEGLAAIARTQMGSKGSESAKEVQGMEQGSDEEAPGGDKGPSQAPTYLSLLFKVLLGCCSLFACCFCMLCMTWRVSKSYQNHVMCSSRLLQQKQRKCHCGYHD